LRKSLLCVDRIAVQVAGSNTNTLSGNLIT
jgi:hypothetical protein